ncbi:MAG TPA: helix-turn-helix domain-containing protein [Thermoplasmata archaeon]|nr:helix-turn-helix domain-containing protein [Thermoplasmata archaeon]
MRVAPEVQLSPEERSRLQAMAGGPRNSARARRARYVLAASQGLENQAIARAEGVSRLTVARWRLRFLRSRLAGLSDQPRPALSARWIPEETVRRIVRTTMAGRSDRRGPWSTRALAAACGVSHMTVRRVWRAYHLRPLRVGNLPFRPDPVIPWVPRDVVGLFLRPPQAALVFSLGPSSELLRRPTPERSEVSFPAMLPAARQDHPPIESTRSGPKGHPSEFPRFLGALERQVAAELPLRILATGSHLTEASFVERWQVHRPEVSLVHVPHWATWKERAVRELRATGQPSARPHQTKTRGEALRSIALFLGDYPIDGAPFEWLAPARAAGTGAAAYRLRYDLAVTGHPGFMSRSAPATPMAPKPAPSSPAREMARIILGKYLRVARRERVTIESWSATLEEANAFSLEALRLGARPLLLYQDEPTYWAATQEVAPEDLAQLGEHRRAALERTDVFVSFFGPSDRERFHALPSAALEKLGDYQDSMYRAAAKAGARAVQMAVGRASPESARMYGVDLAAWRKELVDGCLLDPGELRDRARRVGAALATARELEIRHPNGTDLRLRLRHRKPIVSDGTVHPATRQGSWSLVTLPTGVVAVALDERAGEGVFRSNVRSSVGLSDAVGELAGGRWTFQGGRLRRYAYDEGAELFAESYARAPAGKDRPGSLSIGLNPAIAKAPLLEDEGAGTLTLHIGRNDYVGGSNHVYWWAWLFLRGGDLLVDGRPLLRRGRWAE